MGFLDRLGRVVRANLNSLVNQSEDPEKILEQTVQEMQDNLIQIRQAVAQAIATQKRTERQHAQSQSMAQEWYNRANLALQKQEENLAREALARRKTYQDTATALKQQIDQQSGIVSQLKQNMLTLESKLAEARTKKDMYIARARSAKASEQLNEMLYKLNPAGSNAAIERMEEKVLQMEARAQAMAELSQGDAIERRFHELEQGSDIDQELSAMKARLQGSGRLGGSPSGELAKPTLDDEIAQLRSKLEES